MKISLHVNDINVVSNIYDAVSAVSQKKELISAIGDNARADRENTTLAVSQMPLMANQRSFRYF
jgi:hypothetical protein